MVGVRCIVLLGAVVGMAVLPAHVASAGGTTTGTDDCGDNCEEPTEPVQFVTPVDGATVDPMAPVHITAPYGCFCDFCGCAPEDPVSISVLVDGEYDIGCDEDVCDTRDVNFVLALTPGEHQLIAVADYSFHIVQSEPITVTVLGGGADSGGNGSGSMTTATSMDGPASTSGGGTTTGTTGSTTSTTGGGSGGGGGDSSGCAVHSPPTNSWPLWMLAVVGIGLRAGRRRRR